MIIAALVLAALAALLHVYIFYMESIAWTSPRVRSTFGTSPEEAQATKEMAYNQGFYNLFLALITAIGIALIVSGAADAGAALVYASAGSMAAAAAVLFASSSDKRRAALTQGVLPLLAVISLTIGLALRG